MSRHGTRSAVSNRVAVPLADAPGPPSAVTVVHAETSATVQWTEPPGTFRRVQRPAEPDEIAARSLAPSVVPTTYNVYRVGRTAGSGTATPQPVNATPIEGTDVHAGPHRAGRRGVLSGAGGARVRRRAARERAIGDGVHDVRGHVPAAASDQPGGGRQRGRRQPDLGSEPGRRRRRVRDPPRRDRRRRHRRRRSPRSRRSRFARARIATTRRAGAPGTSMRWSRSTARHRPIEASNRTGSKKAPGSQQMISDDQQKATPHEDLHRHRQLQGDRGARAPRHHRRRHHQPDADGQGRRRPEADPQEDLRPRARARSAAKSSPPTTRAWSARAAIWRRSASTSSSRCRSPRPASAPARRCRAKACAST